MSARSLIVAPALLLLLLATAGCAVTEHHLTASDRESMCDDLRRPVSRSSALELDSTVFLKRDHELVIPGGGPLPAADCAWAITADHATRVMIFYFNATPSFAARVSTDLVDANYIPYGSGWILPVSQRASVPLSVVHLEHFFGARDASREFRVYAELLARPAVVLSITIPHVTSNAAP